MKRSVWVSGLLLSLGGCATSPPPAPPPIISAPPTPIAQSTSAPLKGSDLLAQQPPQVQAAVKQHAQEGAWPTFREENSQLYPYREGPQPVIDCEPLTSTDIQLEAGETITDVALGDSERWQATPAASGDPRNPVPHIAIKPQAPGIRTNLTIYTTRHIYHLSLRSRPGHSTEQVAFYYPDELAAAMAEADRKAAQSKPEDNQSGDIVAAALKTADSSTLNFSYQIDGPAVPWRPLRAFDDGFHVYIQMPPALRTADAPALLVDSAGGTQMVNYRVRGNYYVVDRLFDRAVLVAGVGRQQDRVTVAYTGGKR